MTTRAQRLVRSYLYVPADAGERLDKAASRGADAIIADLEDAVALSSKETASRNAAAWLRSPETHGTERWVRVNAGETGLDDIAAVFAPGLTGICLPKVSDRLEVRRAAEMLDALEQRDGVTAGETMIMPMIESAVAVQALSEIAAAPRVQKLQLGEVDLAADLGLSPGDDESELAFFRSAVVLASAVAGLLPPVGPVSPEFRDLDWFDSSTRRLQRAGFMGRVAIHPAQLDTIHRVFTPTPAEVSAARAMVERYEAALSAGAGVLVGDDGRMIDEAVIRHSRRTVAIAASIEQGDEL